VSKYILTSGITLNGGYFYYVNINNLRYMIKYKSKEYNVFRPNRHIIYDISVYYEDNNIVSEKIDSRDISPGVFINNYIEEYLLPKLRKDKLKKIL
jgi:hypothetical protein